MAQNRRLLRAVVAAACSLPTGLFAQHALAQENIAQAAVASREAESLLAAGKVDEACAKYDESARLDRRGGSVLDLALCREKQGRLGSAYVLFEEAEKKSLEEKRNDRVTTARQKKNVLFARVPRLTVNVSGAADGQSVVAGAVVIPSVEWGKPYPVDPGEHDVISSAPGKAEHKQRISMGLGQRKAVTIPALAAAGAAPPPKKDDPKPEPKKEEPEP